MDIQLIDILILPNATIIKLHSVVSKYIKKEEDERRINWKVGDPVIHSFKKEASISNKIFEIFMYRRKFADLVKSEIRKYKNSAGYRKTLRIAMFNRINSMLPGETVTVRDFDGDVIGLGEFRICKDFTVYVIFDRVYIPFKQERIKGTSEYRLESKCKRFAINV